MSHQESPSTHAAAPAGRRGATVLLFGEADLTLGTGKPDALTEGCRVLRVGTPEEALDVLAREPVDVVVAEDSADSGAGLSLLEKARRIAPEAVRILCAGSLEPELAGAALGEAEAFRIMPEHGSTDDLRAAVRDGIDFRRMAGGGVTDAERAKRFLDHVLPKLPAGTLEIGTDGLVCRANGVARLLFGLSEEELAGRSAIRLGVPCRQTECAAQTFDVPPCSNREVSTLRTWGHERTLLWSCEAAGLRGGCTASFLDITEKPGLEVKIFHAKHEIEAIFDSVTDPTFLVDAERRILRANRALSRHAGKAFRDVLGRPCVELLGSRRDGCAGCRLEQVFETAAETHDEVRLPDGRIFKIHVFPIVKRGRAERAVVRYQDVTAERDLERRLLQAEKMASIGQLSAGIAHEINNPMGFISANLEMLFRYTEDLKAFGRSNQALARAALSGERDPLSAWQEYVRERATLDMDYLFDDVGSLVRECYDGTERIRDIVADLRAFSHPAEHEWEEADLREGLDRTLTLVHSEFKNRCEVVRDYGEMPKIRCFPQQLNRVFLNLIVNAAQAVQDHGTVTIRTRAQADHVVVEVADTGIGIAPENLQRIFDPFFTTKPVGQGTGLGLHLALGIVQKHGGDLRVVSSVGEGSTFSVVLPVDPRQPNGLTEA